MLKENPVLLRYKIGNIGSITLVGTFAGIIIGYLISVADSREPIAYILRALVIGTFTGLSIAVFEELLFHTIFRKKPYLFLLTLRTSLYTIIIAFWLMLVNAISFTITDKLSFTNAINFYINLGTFNRDIIIVILGTFILISLIQARSLLRKGEITKFILGIYHRPREVKKIFLFLDIKSSTTIAEKLGHLKYSEFLIDFFYDLSNSILMAKAEIYQYVGDEIILSWPFEKGLQDAQCINCFFDIKFSIESHKEKYLESYGFYPEFKAGLHGGKVVVTWIGDIKKEIVYHGDVLNIASRLESECNKYNQSFLISEDILSQIILPAHIEANYINGLLLKGKEEQIKVYGLDIIKKPVLKPA